MPKPNAKKEPEKQAPAKPTPLTGKQKRFLRAIGHDLDPVVMVGKNGLTESSIAALEVAIDRHELIKVRLHTECPEDRDDVAERAGAGVKAEVAQVLGRTFLLYRRHPKKPVIELPRETAKKSDANKAKKPAAAPVQREEVDDDDGDDGDEEET